MSELTTRIDGYEVVLDTDADGDGTVSQCYVSKGRHAGSLDHLIQMATLDDDGPLVPRSVIEQIEKWALRNGY